MSNECARIKLDPVEACRARVLTGTRKSVGRLDESLGHLDDAI